MLHCGFLEADLRFLGLRPPQGDGCALINLRELDCTTYGDVLLAAEAQRAKAALWY